MTRTRLDHVLVGAADLDAAIEAWAAHTGVRPVHGGSHEGVGTRNALADLGGDVYLELIAPDPEQSARSPMRAALERLPHPRPVGWCFSCADLDRMRDDLAGGDVEWRLVPMSRATPEGGRVAWRLLLPTPSPGPALPFLIDWGAAARPSGLPEGCLLRSVTAVDPDAARLRETFARLGVDARVVEGTTSGLDLAVDTPGGPRQIGPGGLTG